MGGNAAAHAFFSAHECTTKDLKEKYASRTAILYRDKLAAAAQAALKSWQGHVHVGEGVPPSPPPASAVDKDFWLDHQVNESRPSSSAISVTKDQAAAAVVPASAAAAAVSAEEGEEEEEEDEVTPVEAPAAAAAADQWDVSDDEIAGTPEDACSNDEADSQSAQLKKPVDPSDQPASLPPAPAPTSRPATEAPATAQPATIVKKEWQKWTPTAPQPALGTATLSGWGVPSKPRKPLKIGGGKTTVSVGTGNRGDVDHSCS